MCESSKSLVISYLFYQLIGLVGRVFANGLGDLGSIPGCVIPKTLKIILDTSLLNTQQYKVKWSNPGKGVVPSPTPRCSSYQKGSLLVTLDYGRQLYFLGKGVVPSPTLWCSSYRKGSLLVALDYGRQLILAEKPVDTEKDPELMR